MSICKETKLEVGNGINHSGSPDKLTCILSLEFKNHSYFN